MANTRFFIDVGGVQYVSTIATLSKSPTLKTLIAAHSDASDPLFVDRDGFAFHYILNFLRNGTVQVGEDNSYLEFLVLEAGFYGLAKMESQLSKKMSLAPKQDVGALVSLSKDVRYFRDLAQRLIDARADLSDP